MGLLGMRASLHVTDKTCAATNTLSSPDILFPNIRPVSETGEMIHSCSCIGYNIIYHPHRRPTLVLCLLRSGDTGLSSCMVTIISLQMIHSCSHIGCNTWFNWVHLGSLGFIWDNLGSLGNTWMHLNLLGLSWDHLGTLWFTWVHLGSRGFIWVQWGFLGLTWVS